MTNVVYIYYPCPKLDTWFVEIAANISTNIDPYDFRYTYTECIEILKDYLEDKIEHVLGTGVDKTQIYEYELNINFPGLLIQCQEISSEVCSGLIYLRSKQKIGLNSHITVKIQPFGKHSSTIILEVRKHGYTHHRHAIQIHAV